MQFRTCERKPDKLNYFTVKVKVKMLHKKLFNREISPGALSWIVL